MSNVTKHYIELTDITGLLVECSNCKMTQTFTAAPTSPSIPVACPACQALWVQSMEIPDVLKPLRDVYTAAAQLKTLMQQKEKRGIGFNLQLELDPALFEVKR